MPIAFCSCLFPSLGQLDAEVPIESVISVAEVAGRAILQIYNGEVGALLLIVFVWVGWGRCHADLQWRGQQWLTHGMMGFFREYMQDWVSCVSIYLHI